MSFVIVSAADVLYGPTAISTEDAILHDAIAEQSASSSSSLTISRRRQHKLDKKDRIIRKYEAKLAECTKDKHGESKAEKIRSKMDYFAQREKERIAVNEEKKINFDPNGKAIVFKVEDAPVRVLNKLACLGYQIMPSAGGSTSHSGQRSGSFVWTLHKANYVPTPIYPTLNMPS